MPRFNLVFHGMMVFYEADDSQVLVIMPKTPGHRRFYCTAPEPSKETMRHLKKGSYCLTGAQPKPATLKDLMVPACNLVLRKDEVRLNMASAGDAAIFWVPMPHKVRQFRSGEPDSYEYVLGSTTDGLTLQQPAAFSDVVVFSYAISSGQQVELSGLSSASATMEDTVTWVLASLDVPNDLAEAPAPEPSADGTLHTTAINDLLTIAKTGQTPAFRLSGLGRKDGPHETGIGLSPNHMATWKELPESETVGKENIFSGGTKICTGLVISKCQGRFGEIPA